MPNRLSKRAYAEIRAVQVEEQLREEIARLTDLQRLDREMQELGESLASVTSRVDQLRTGIEAQRNELERLAGEAKDTEQARRRLEGELAEGEARIRDKRMRQNLVRNEKELQALGHEVETLKEHNQRLEAELLAQMEGADPRVARISELTGLIDEGISALRAAELEIAGQAEELKTALGKKRLERETLATQVDTSLLQRYEMIFSRRAGLAVALAKSGTCQGCRMRLPPQLYNEIQKFETIHYCPNCQRILSFET